MNLRALSRTLISAPIRRHAEPSFFFQGTAGSIVQLIMRSGQPLNLSVNDVFNKREVFLKEITNDK